MMSKTGVVNELHKNARRNYERRTVLQVGIQNLYQADLVEMIPYASVNRGYKYILTVVDCFSKRGFAFPIKTKTAKDVSLSLRKLFSKGFVPKNIQTDDGGEFFSKMTQNLFKEFGIHHYSSYSVKKASVVEIFNKTLKNRMWKIFSMQGNYRWLKILPKIVSDYNNTNHSKIKMRPIDVKKEHEKLLLRTVYQKNQTIEPIRTRFKVGDVVRISRQKALFEKGFTPNWSTELFIISSIQPGHPTTFLLKDYENKKIRGSFYEQEMQKTNFPDTYLVEKVIRKKGAKVLIKWLGMASEHNSWIDKKELL